MITGLGIVALAACTSSVDDVVFPTATVRLTGGRDSANRGKPIAGAPVAFVDPNGVAVTMTQTDEAGLATGPAPDGTTVHVLEPIGSQDTYGFLYSVLDVSGGDVIQLGESPYARYVSYTIGVGFPPPPTGSRVTATALTRCLADAFVDGTTVALRLGPGCENEITTVLLTARDETTGLPVGFLVVPIVPMVPGTTINAGTDWQPGTTFTWSYTGFPDDAQIASSLWIRHVYLDRVGFVAAGGAGSGVATVLDVPMSGDHYVITTVTIPDVRAGSGMIIDPRDGTQAYELDGSARLPGIWDSSYDRDTRVFHWSSTDVTVPVDAVQIRTGFYTPDPVDQKSIQWTVYSPDNRGEVTVPAIPDELFPSAQFRLCCDGWQPHVVTIDLDQGTYADVLRTPDVLASFRDRPIGLVDGNDVVVPRGRWRVTWSGLSP